MAQSCKAKTSKQETLIFAPFGNESQDEFTICVCVCAYHTYAYVHILIVCICMYNYHIIYFFTHEPHIIQIWAYHEGNLVLYGSEAIIMTNAKIHTTNIA